MEAPALTTGPLPDTDVQTNACLSTSITTAASSSTIPIAPALEALLEFLVPSPPSRNTPKKPPRCLWQDQNTVSCSKRLAVYHLTLHIHTPAPPYSDCSRLLTHCLFLLADRGINTFSPEGRLFQVEYSLEAIKLGSTAIGVATNEGVVLGVEKRVTSTLLETSSVEKIVEIDRHIGCAMSGLQADARSMIEHARVETQSHHFNYNETMRVESCTQAICDLALRFGESADGEESIMSRPFGVALLIAGYDEDGPSLYHAEPTGTFYRYDAKAIGSGSEGAQAELQNEYHKVS